ncbi:hypothetical protein Tco_1068882 [Tanacetum coccineum]|uniref:Uncharacterized protein n=1 Tax=Tanacetum coccineum TaxID=301880 RepID=A0ABQ5HIV0_9ASTR
MHLGVRSEVLSCLMHGFFRMLFDFISYAFSDSLLLTPLCCDDIHDVTPWRGVTDRAFGYREVGVFVFLFSLFRHTGYSIAYDSKEEPIEEEPLQEPNEEGYAFWLTNAPAGFMDLKNGRITRFIGSGVELLKKKSCLPSFPIIIRVFDVLYLKRCIEGSVGHMFFGLKLEKFGRLDQNWYKRQQIRVEVDDKVMLEVSSWKEVVHFGKKEL